MARTHGEAARQTGACHGPGPEPTRDVTILGVLLPPFASLATRCPVLVAGQRRAPGRDESPGHRQQASAAHGTSTMAWSSTTVTRDAASRLSRNRRSQESTTSRSTTTYAGAMGHKPWDRAWRRADKARERNAARAEMWADMETITLDDMRAWRQATVTHKLDDVIVELGFTQEEIDAAE